MSTGSLNATSAELCSKIQIAATEPSTTVTSEGGTKRVLTPSPDLFLKKSCIRSDIMAIEKQTGDEIAMEDGTGYVSLPLPVDAEEVTAHLKDTMLPEIQNMIQQQILTQQTADIKAIVSTAINDAVGQINETLMKEINTVKEENKKLKSENSELSTTVIDLKEGVDKL